MRTVYSLLLALWSAAGAAQTMYKCVDDERRVTYSNLTCAKQGLKDAGPVADRTTTMPFAPAQKSDVLPTQKLSPPLEMPKTDTRRDDAAEKRPK